MSKMEVRAACGVITALVVLLLWSAVLAGEDGGVCYFPGNLLAERMPAVEERRQPAYSYVCMHPQPIDSMPMLPVAVLSVRRQVLTTKEGQAIPLWGPDGRLSAAAAASLDSQEATALEVDVDALHELDAWRVAAQEWWQQNTYWAYSPKWARLRQTPWTCLIYGRRPGGRWQHIGEAVFERSEKGKRAATMVLTKRARFGIRALSGPKNFMIVVSFPFRAQFASPERAHLPFRPVAVSRGMTLVPMSWLKAVDKLPTHVLWPGVSRADATKALVEWAGRAAASHLGHPLASAQGYAADTLGGFIGPYLKDAVEVVSARSIPRVIRVLADKHVLVSVNRDIFRTKFQRNEGALSTTIRDLLLLADRGIPDDGLSRREVEDDNAGLALLIADGIRIPRAAVDARSRVLAASLRKLLAEAADPSQSLIAFNLQRLREAPKRLVREGLRNADGRGFWAMAHAAFLGTGTAINQGSSTGKFSSPLKKK